MGNDDAGKCVGVDGARSGWLAVRDIGERLAWQVHADAASLLATHRDAVVIAVDIPIGLADRGRRAADDEARRFVGGRRACSIFATPVRGVLDATSQAEASRRHRDIDGRGFGAQSFAILPKIRQWDQQLQADPVARQQVREIHPEVCFAALNGGAGQGLHASKHGDAGIAHRIDLLAPVFGRDRVLQLLAAVPQREAKRDDVLDALAALWSAVRIAGGAARSLPDPAPGDGTGLPAAIWY